jgi:hypothetical protein
MWELGGVVAIGTKFYDTSTPPVLVAASSVVATITLPDGTTNIPTVTNPSTGVYAANYTPTQAGRHGVSWSGVVGGLTVKYTDVFNVQEAAAPLIIGLDEARDYLNIPSGETVSDEELRGFIEAATRLIEEHVGPVVRQTRIFTVKTYGPCIPLPFDPLSLTSGVLIRSGTTVDVTNMVVENGVLRSKTLASLPTEPWTLTCVVGRTVIGANILKAAAEVVSDLWSSQRGASIRGGEPQRIPYALSYKALNLLDPDDQLGVA